MGITVVAVGAGILLSPLAIHAEENIRYWNKTFSARYDIWSNWWLAPEGGETTAPNDPDAIAAFLLGGNGPATFWEIDFSFISPELDHFYFGEDAGYYEMNVGSSSLTFSGLGIVNESGKRQGLNAENGGLILFQNEASAGFSRLVAVGTGWIRFRDDATASNATVRGRLDFSGINGDSFQVGSFLGGSVTMGSKDFILDSLAPGETQSINGFFDGTSDALLIQQDHGSRTISAIAEIGGVRLDSGALTLDAGEHTWSSSSLPLDIRGGDMTISGGAKVEMAGGEARIRGVNDVSASLTIIGDDTEVSIPGLFIAGAHFHGDQHLEVSDRAVLEANDFFVGYYGSGTASIMDGRVSVLGAAVGTGDSLDDRGVVEISGRANAPGRLYVTYDLDVGGRQWETSGSGYLLAEDWTLVQTNNLNLARAAGGVGEVEITGWNAELNVLSDITSGYAGTGTLIVSGAATAEAAGVLYAGRDAGSNGTVIVRGGGSTLESGGIIEIGSRGEGLLTIESGGTVTSTASGQNAAIARHPGSHGHVSVDGGTLNIQNSYLGVGYYGDGSLSISNGGTASLGGAVVGYFNGGSGVATVSGDGSRMTVHSEAYVGFDANTDGELAVRSNGNISVASNFYLGSWGDGDLILSDGGTFSLAGGNGTIQAAINGGSSGSVTIGGKAGESAAGVGILDVVGVAFGSGDGELRFNHDDESYAFTNASGSAIGITGDASLIHEGPGTTVLSSDTMELDNIQVDSGSLVFDGATTEAAGDVIAGATPGSDGGIVVRGNGTILDYAGETAIGYYGKGHLSIEDGAALTSTTPGTESGIGVQAGSTGLVRVDGGDLDLSQGSLGVGVAGEGFLEISGGGSASIAGAAVGYLSGGVGELTVSEGGEFSLSDGSGILQVAVEAGSSGTVSIGGKRGESASGTGTLDVAAVTFGSGDGELRFNHNEDSYVFTNASGSAINIAGDGSVVHEGPGTTVLSGTVDYTGLTNVSEGSLELTYGLLSEGAGIVVGEGATLAVGDGVVRDIQNEGSVRSLGATPLTFSGIVSGTGSFQGDFRLAGITRPGASAGLMEIDGDLSFDPDHILEIEIGGLTRGSEYDALNISGSFVAGGTLTAILLNDFQPVFGDEFQLFDFGGIMSGTFDAIELPDLAGSLDWDASGLYDMGTLSVIPEPRVYGLLLGAISLIVALVGRRRVRRTAFSDRRSQCV